MVSCFYVRNNSNAANITMNIIQDPANWEAGLLNDIDEFQNADPNFRIRIVSQSFKQAISSNDDLIRRYPELKIKILSGSDSGMTTKEYCEDINETCSACNVFILSHVTESGVNIPYQ